MKSPVFRARPLAVVMGAAAVLPIAGPVIFLSLPGLRGMAAPAEEAPAGTPAETSGEPPAEGAPAANAPHGSRCRA